MPAPTTNVTLSAITCVFKRQKTFAEHCIDQLDNATFFARQSDGLNSVAAIVKHVAGSMTSRFTDFLTTDGEKPSRDREAEFVPNETRTQLMDLWQASWHTLFTTLDALTPADLSHSVTIRGEPHTVAHALMRALDHYGYHVGQIALLARMGVPDRWRWFTILPGESQQFNRAMRGRFDVR